MDAIQGRDILLGRRLKASMIEAGIDSPARMGVLVGRGTRQVNNYLNGVIPPADVLQRWAAATGKPLEYFLPSEPKVENETASPKVVHPGVEAIASNAQLVEECGFTEENITAARSLFWLEADGRPHIIKTISEAMDYLRLMQRS